MIANLIKYLLFVFINKKGTANKYEFANDEPSNYEVQKSIIQRLADLQNVRIPKKLN